MNSNWVDKAPIDSKERDAQMKSMIEMLMPHDDGIVQLLEIFSEELETETDDDTRLAMCIMIGSLVLTINILYGIKRDDLLLARKEKCS